MSETGDTPAGDIWGPYALAEAGDPLAEATRAILEDILPRPPLGHLVRWLVRVLRRRERGSLSLLVHQCRRRQFFMERHLDSPVVWRLCQDDGLLRRLREHVGERLVLWRSELWVNDPGNRVVPAWHHDVYPRLLQGTGRRVNAYVALTDIDESNGFEYLPASVRAGREIKISRTDPHTGNHFFHVPEGVERKAAAVALRPGEFILFSGELIHRSLRNTGGRARVALTLRVASPSLHVLPGYSPNYGPVAL